MMNERFAAKHFSKECQNILVETGSPNVYCSILPSHWRSNKQLPHKFKVVVLTEVPDGTMVTVSAANEDTAKGDLKNNVGYIQSQVATFPDLRFIGRSGRGKRFHLVITIHCFPSQVAVYENAIKVTIDGPRQPRMKHKLLITESDDPMFHHHHHHHHHLHQQQQQLQPLHQQRKRPKTFLKNAIVVLPDSSNNF